MSEPTSSTPSAPAPAPRPRRGSPGGFFAAWIGIGALLGLLLGAAIASFTDGPAMVSRERSVLWMAVFFACVLALLGAVVAVLLDGRRSRR